MSDLLDIRGIGPVLAERLQAAGITDSVEFATASSDTLTAIPGISPARAQSLLKAAQALNATFAEPAHQAAVEDVPVKAPKKGTPVAMAAPEPADTPKADVLTLVQPTESEAPKAAKDKTKARAKKAAKAKKKAKAEAKAAKAAKAAKKAKAAEKAKAVNKKAAKKAKAAKKKAAAKKAKKKAVAKKTKAAKTAKIKAAETSKKAKKSKKAKSVKVKKSLKTGKKKAA